TGLTTANSSWAWTTRSASIRGWAARSRRRSLCPSPFRPTSTEGRTPSSIGTARPFSPRTPAGAGWHDAERHLFLLRPRDAQLAHHPRKLRHRLAVDPGEGRRLPLQLSRP